MEPRDVEPRDVEPRDAEPRDVEPRDAEPRDVEPRDVEPVEPRDVEPRDAEPRDAEPVEPQDAEPVETGGALVAEPMVAELQRVRRLRSPQPPLYTCVAIQTRTPALTVPTTASAATSKWSNLGPTSL